MNEPHSAGPARPRDAARQPRSSLFRRLALGLAASTCAALIAALLETAWAADGPASFAAIARADAGLLAPVGLLWGVLVALFGWALEPARPTSLADGWRALDLRDRDARRRVAALGLVGGTVLVLFATTAAHLAARVMRSEGANGASGLTLAVLTALLATSAAALALALAEAIALALRQRDRTLDPRWAISFGLLAGAALFAYGIAKGDTSGQGEWLGVWGVLKRPELDLRAPGLLGFMALSALLLPAALSPVPTWVACALAVLPLALTVRSARALADEPIVLSALEHGAPLGQMSLRLLRRAFDRDHDGFSAWFGGGDCDDRHATINPAATDLPGNGVDEDCSGSDAVLYAEPAVAAKQPAPLRRDKAHKLPDDLNVLLITVDTLRGDLGYAGNPKPISPNLDALAARSVVFERAYSLASYTGKSVGPLLIGKYPSETHRGWGHFNRYLKDTLVAERLRARGIRTLGVQAHWYFSAPFGLSRGFDVWDNTAQPPPAGTDTDNYVTGGALSDAAIRQLSNPENAKRRFFAWMHYVDPHAEYVRHAGAPDLGTGMRAAYDGEVWYTDAQIGRVLRFVEQQPWAAKTAIIVTSDHGEAFGEHHLIRHGVELWEELVRVPLIVHVPGVPALRVAARRSAIDLVPTLLDLFEAPAVAFASDGPGDDFVSGRSLLDDILAAPGAEHEARAIFIDMPPGPNNDEHRAFIRNDFKLSAVNGARWQLFNLATDPGEKIDLASDKALLAQKRADYQAFRAGLREVAVRP